MGGDSLRQPSRGRSTTDTSLKRGRQRGYAGCRGRRPLQRDGGVRLPCTGEVEVAGETPSVSRLAGDRRLTPPSKREATGAAGRRGRRPLQRDGEDHLTSLRCVQNNKISLQKRKLRRGSFPLRSFPVRGILFRRCSESRVSRRAADSRPYTLTGNLNSFMLCRQRIEGLETGG